MTTVINTEVVRVLIEDLAVRVLKKHKSGHLSLNIAVATLAWIPLDTFCWLRIIWLYVQKLWIFNFMHN